MNIFATSDDPRRCALALDDKRLVKMALESTQILSAVMHNYGLAGPYRPTHQGHPCVLWAGVNRLNYDWLLEHLRHLGLEYSYRFGKDHRSLDHLRTLERFAPRVPWSGKLDEFPNCTKYKEVADVYRAYRLHLSTKWAEDKRPPKWTGRQAPDWLISKHNLPAVNGVIV